MIPHVEADYFEALSRAFATHPLPRPRHRQELGALDRHTLPPALTIGAFHKSRWPVELFFKCIKQRVLIKRSYRTSENALKSPLWIAAAFYVLVAITKKELNLKASLHTPL